MNGLATDLQMFALQTLRIPLPGRHPPSPVPDEPAKLRYCHIHLVYFPLVITQQLKKSSIKVEMQLTKQSIED